MTAYMHVTDDVLVVGRPCILYSVTFSNLGGDDARINIYNGRAANAADLAVVLTCGTKETKQFRWKGLEFTGGLYMDNVERTDDITIEWEPVGYPGEKKSVVEYITESAS